jgi:hypothetical protein
MWMKMIRETTHNSSQGCKFISVFLLTEVGETSRSVFIRHRRLVVRKRASLSHYIKEAESGISEAFRKETVSSTSLSSYTSIFNIIMFDRI